MGFSNKLNIFLILFIYVIILIVVCASTSAELHSPVYNAEIAWSPPPASPSSIHPSIKYNDFPKWHTSLTVPKTSFYHLLPADETFDELSNASD